MRSLSVRWSLDVGKIAHEIRPCLAEIPHRRDWRRSSARLYWIGGDLRATLTESLNDAALSQPLLDQHGRLILSLAPCFAAAFQVRPARSFHRNGKLRIAFRQANLPDGAV